MLGFLTNDIVGPALLGGLVLIVMLIGFTVMQHAFAGGITHGIVSDVERRALALTGAGDMIWDWDVSADKVFTSPETETMLGLKSGTLEGPAAKWLEVLHPLDRDRFRATLDSVLEQRRGRVTQDFRMRTADGHYLWFALRARPVVGSDGEVVRLVGTLTDVTEFKTAEERLLHDAVHDNLTGLPNRELFLDRLDAVLGFAKADGKPTPHAPDRDGDRPRPLQAGQRFGRHGGRRLDPADLARRLGRLIKPQDTLARLSGDQFGLILLSERDAGAHHRLCRNHPPHAARADHLQRPRNFPHRLDRLDARRQRAAARRGSAQGRRTRDVSRQAQRRRPHRSVQAGHARAQDRPAVDRIRSAPRASSATRSPSSISRSCGSRIAPSPASRRWRAGTIRSSGRLSPAEFITIAEETGLIVELGLFVLERTARQLSAWQRTVRQRESAVRQRQRLVAPIAAPRSDPGSAHRAGARRRWRAARSSSNSPNRW